MTHQRVLAICCGALALLVLGSTAALIAEDRAASAAGPQTVRCAVIGGLGDTGVWTEIATRFEKATGHRIEVVCEGNKRVIVPYFEQGLADMLTMHSSDAVMNLVADGYGEDPQPWARNDMVVVGPPDDPAGVRDERDAVEALKKIAAKGKLLMHASNGANEVLANLIDEGQIELDPGRVISLPTQHHREMLGRVSEERAYALVGRIPFLRAKFARYDMQIMVQGDARLRRPYVAITAVRDPQDARYLASRALVQFLRSPETQDWLQSFGQGQLDAHPLLFSVKVNRSKAAGNEASRSGR